MRHGESPTPFRVLYREFLLAIVDLEILSARADIVKLLGQVAAILAALSLMFCGGALRLVRSAAPASAKLLNAWVDEHFLIATSMAIVGLFAVLAWDAVLPNQRDVFVLTPLPVQRRTIFLAKMAAVATALGSIVLALNVFTGVTYPLAIGGANGGLLGIVRAIAAYWVTMLASAVFIFGCIFGMQGMVALLLSRQRFLRVSAVLQLGTFCLILASYFLRPSLVTADAILASADLKGVALLPSYWFLGLFQQLNGSPHATLDPLAARAWAGLAVAVTGATIALLVSYFRTVRKIVEEPDLRPDRSGLGWSPPLGNSLRTSIIQFCARTLIRSGQHRMMLACYLGAGFAIALTYGRSALYTSSGYVWHEVNRPVLVATVVMTCFAVVGMRVAFSVPSNLPANWMFRTAVARYAQDYLVEIRSALLLLAVTPVVALSLVSLLSIWPFWPVVGHILVLSLLGLILTDICLLRFRKIPFACSYLPGKAQIHVTAGAGVLVLIGLADIGVKFEAKALQDPAVFMWMLGPVAMLATVIHRHASERIRAPETVIQFDEESDSAVLALDLQPDGVMSQINRPGLGNPGRGHRVVPPPLGPRRR
jgi:hypothetical protein